MAKSTEDGEPKQYEFDEKQEVVIGELAGAMNFVGNVSIGLAILMAAGGVAMMTTYGGGVAGFTSVMQAAFLAVIGSWTRSGARSFQAVVDTKGSDISHLMTALDVLRRVFVAQRNVLVVAILLIVGVIALAFLGLHF